MPEALENSELEQSDITPPKVIVHQASDADKSEGNAANDLVNGNSPEQDGGDNGSHAHQEESNNKRPDTGEIKDHSTDEVKANLSEPDTSGTVKVDDEATKNEEKALNESNGSDKLKTASETAEPNENQLKDGKSEDKTGNSIQEGQSPKDLEKDLSRSKTPEIIITGTDEEGSNQTSPMDITSGESPEKDVTEKSQSPDNPASTEGQHDDGERQSVNEVTESTSITEKEESTAASKTPEETPNEPKKNLLAAAEDEKPKEGESESDRSTVMERPPSESSAKTATESAEIGDELTKSTNSGHSNESTKSETLLELVTNGDTELISPSNSLQNAEIEDSAPIIEDNLQEESKDVIEEAKEKQARPTEQLDSNHATANDEITSVVSEDRPVGADDSHKDGYDASVSGNEDDSPDKPAYVPSAIEETNHNNDATNQISETEIPSALFDNSTASIDTLVPSTTPPPATPEYQPSPKRSPKSVKFQNKETDENSDTDDVVMVSVSNDASEDSRRDVITPMPSIVRKNDLEERDDMEKRPESPPESIEETLPRTPTPKEEPVQPPEGNNGHHKDENNKEKELEACKIEIERLQHKIQDLEDQITSLKNEKAADRKTVDGMNSKITRLTDENTNNKKTITDNEKEIEELKVEVRKYKEKLEAAERPSTNGIAPPPPKKSSVCVIL